MLTAGRRRSRAGGGQALVELSVLLPVLLVCLLGAAQLGVILYTSVSVDGAARDGALAASESPIDSEAYTYNGSSTSSGPGVTCSASGSASGNPVCVAWAKSQGSLSSLALDLYCGGYDGTCASTTTTGDCAPAGGSVTVEASATAPIFIPLIGNLFADSPSSGVRTVVSTVTMRVEPCSLTNGH
jgi:Flp pilus assembly protein TadG